METKQMTRIQALSLVCANRKPETKSEAVRIFWALYGVTPGEHNTLEELWAECQAYIAEVE